MLFGSAVCLAVGSALAISACSKAADKGSDSAAGQDKSKAVLTVNGTVVTQGELDMLMRVQPGQREIPPAARAHMLDNLTLQILAAQEAVKAGFDKKPEVQDQIDMSRNSILAQAYVKDYFANHKPTDAELQAGYDKMKADAAGNQYHARHILVKTEAEAKAIIAKLNKDPKQFGDLAKAQSQDPVSKVKGGDLGWFDSKMMVPEFTAAVAKLEKGKFTEEPVKSTFGYHVIILDDTRPASDALPPFEQLKPSLAQRANQDDLKKFLEDLKSKAKIEEAQAEPAPPAPPAMPPQPAPQPAPAAPVAPVAPASAPAAKS